MHELTVVMPVYNEQDSISGVIADWLRVLERSCADGMLLAVNDGSTDATAQRLSGLSGEPRLRVVHKANAGHGPAILFGYHLAVRDSEWVFQTDSDDEIKANQFDRLWDRRADGDFVFGVRRNRPQSPGRAFVSAASRLVVHALSDAAVRDVNVPFRLMRRAHLEALLDRIPPATFAPNLILAGLAGRMQARIVNVPVECAARATPGFSLAGWRIWRAALLSLRQTAAILLRERSRVCALP